MNIELTSPRASRSRAALPAHPGCPTARALRISRARRCACAGGEAAARCVGPAATSATPLAASKGVAPTLGAAGPARLAPVTPAPAPQSDAAAGPNPTAPAREAEALAGTESNGKSARSALTARLNWLRAAVLGANDGIVSVAGLVIGVAAYDPANTTAIMLAAVAGLLAGAFSMAAGEYVSVSSQRDSEAAIVAAERAKLAADPEGELAELARMYQERGVSAATAMQVAKELSAKDALAAHLALETGIDQEALVNPWSAAISSAISFTLGALLPIVAVWLAPATWVRVPVTFVSVLVALALTGWVSAHLGEAGKGRAVVRLLVGGLLAMAATWGIGALLGVSV